jgi:hypothetical protein
MPIALIEILSSPLTLLYINAIITNIYIIFI